MTVESVGLLIWMGFVLVVMSPMILIRVNNAVQRRAARRREAKREPTLDELMAKALEAKRELNETEFKSWETQYDNLRGELLPCSCIEVSSQWIQSMQGDLVRVNRQMIGQDACEAHRVE